MLKKTIKFKSVDGEDLEEDFYFSLSKAELAEMELAHTDGFGAYLSQIIKTKDGALIMAIFKDIILKTVGKRSEDGRKFVKSEEISNDFLHTDAYSVLFMELCTDAAASAAFMNGVVPADLAEDVAKGQKVAPLNAVGDIPAWIREDRDPTKAEMISMTQEQLADAFVKKSIRDAAKSETE